MRGTERMLMAMAIMALAVLSIFAVLTDCGDESDAVAPSVMRITINVTIDPNGGDGEPFDDSIELNITDQTYFDLNLAGRFTRDGYELAGFMNTQSWNDKTCFYPTEYTSKMATSYPPEEGSTLYALWVPEGKLKINPETGTEIVEGDLVVVTFNLLDQIVSKPSWLINYTNLSGVPTDYYATAFGFAEPGDITIKRESSNGYVGTVVENPKAGGTGTAADPYHDMIVKDGYEFYATEGTAVNIELPYMANSTSVTGNHTSFGLYCQNRSLSGILVNTGTMEFDATFSSGTSVSIRIHVVDIPNRVSFSSNGSIIETHSVQDGMTVTPINPTLDGYTFKGWYTDNTFSTLFDFATPITSDITLFAKWEGNFAFTSEPTADGTVTPISTMDGTVVFDASASEGSVIVWDFGDGTTATGTYQTHYYSQPGTYIVKLMVYNDNGDFDMKEYYVEIPEKALGGGI